MQNNIDLEKLQVVEQNIVQGVRLSEREMNELLKIHSAEKLAELANNLRKHFIGDQFDTCSILNARSGRCTEDCKWCSQSVFHKSNVESYPLIGFAEARDAAEHNASRGVRRFSLVTSGRTLSDEDLKRSAEIFKGLKRGVEIELCASMGLLTKEQLQKLYDSGVRRYHCNLETAPSYFPSLCTTHTIEDKTQTIRWAQEVGMEVCSGGIIGMGETMEQRVELAVVLRELGVRSVPINLLNPIKGTKLEGVELLADDEVIRSMAMFRIVNPEAHIRFAGGRVLYKHLERRLLRAGVSASIMGDMLTTSGSGIDVDKELFESEGFVL